MEIHSNPPTLYYGFELFEHFGHYGEQRAICLLWMLTQKVSGGDPRESMGGICESPK